MASVPSGERVHIGVFGRRNAGKSSIVNKITGQSVSLVSGVPGTTTDAVRKAMEILPIGPVVIIDTPGFDDSGELGKMRVEATGRVLGECDAALLVIDPQTGEGETEKALIKLFAEKNIAYIKVYSKSDIKKEPGLSVSSETGEGIPELLEALSKIVKEKENPRRIIGDLLSPGDTVILVTPIDSAAPKGRLILPQVETLRDVLDSGAMALVVKETEYEKAISSLASPPRLVVTDSQVFGLVSKLTPPSVPLTGFSVLMARYKGILSSALSGAAKLDSLRDGDRILISESCTHKKQCDDIGTVKLPGWIRAYSGKDISFDFSSGKGFPEDISPYSLIVQCGGCMITEREVKERYTLAENAGIPITNYGTAIAKMNGILPRIASLFVE